MANEKALNEAIKNEPYFKVTNLMDFSDIDYALERLKFLTMLYGESKLSKETEDKIYSRKINLKLRKY